MKKWLALLLALTLTVGLAACGGGSNSAAPAASGSETAASGSEGGEASSSAGGEGRVLKIGHYVDPANAEDPNSVKMVALFDKISEATGIEIQIEVIPWDQIESKLVMTSQAGTPSADLYLMSSQKLASVVNAGVLMPLDDYIAADMNKDDYVPATFEAGTYAGDGKVYCILSSIHSRGLWYNKDLMPEAPKTQDELVEYAKAATSAEDNTYGFAFWGNQHYGSVENIVASLVWDRGGALCDAEGKATWASTESQEAIQFLDDCLRVHEISPETCLTMTDYREILDMFMAGQLGSMINGTFSIADLQETDAFKEGKIGFAPIPGVEGPAPNFSNGWAWAIPTKSADPDLAWEFVNAFMQPDIQTEHAAFEGGMPATVASYDDPLFSEGIYKDFYDNMVNGRSMDPFVYFQEGLEAFSMAKSSYFLDDGQDLDGLLQTAQDDFNAKYYG